MGFLIQTASTQVFHGGEPFKFYEPFPHLDGFRLRNSESHSGQNPKKNFRPNRVTFMTQRGASSYSRRFGRGSGLALRSRLIKVERPNPTPNEITVKIVTVQTIKNLFSFPKKIPAKEITPFLLCRSHLWGFTTPTVCPIFQKSTAPQTVTSNLKSIHCTRVFLREFPKRFFPVRNRPLVNSLATSIDITNGVLTISKINSFGIGISDSPSAAKIYE